MPSPASRLRVELQEWEVLEETLELPETLLPVRVQLGGPEEQEE